MNENIISALHAAIRYQTRYEREQLGYTEDSAMVVGWKESLKALRNGDIQFFVMRKPAPST